MDNIRISRIQVKKLFGTINYDIHLDEIEPIAIIIAPNGRGKTTLLNLLSFVLNPSDNTFKTIQTIPFEVFRLVLSNGKKVELKRDPRKTDAKKQTSNQSRNQEWLKYIANMLKHGTTNSLLDPLFENTNYIVSIYEDEKELDSIDYHEETNGKYLSFDFFGSPDSIESDPSHRRVQSNSSASRNKKLWDKQNELLIKHKCNVFVNYIKTDRIQPFITSNESEKSPLVKASDFICDLVKNATDQYNESVSMAKDKLPQMFLDGEEGSTLNCNEFLNGWSEYRKKLNQFQEIGLITPTEDFINGRNIPNEYKENGRFLSTYLSAFKDTTTPLLNIYNKLHLFKQILDERNAITGKKLMFKREGITLSSKGMEIDLDSLSSGEKHDFIMFFNLLFNCQDGGLVLIDEPEISLHIQWQETYLDRLIAICKMNDLQAIVATHSPNIVSTHYDLLVDKGETDE